MFEHFFQCPYCWEEISMLLDSSITNTTYIEDCEVCCRPIEVHVSFDTEQNLESFSAVDIEQ
ncbi:CPXCG motif-containing cysteine-rich protein [Aureibaculum luteum]|uniref:CPXCG motif-containing cysteine-rich protein n=1 Tax=Aureibaculum luteum TaxID=1548456 RepID=UPI000E52D307|nr:CPXCG motif-containing cysteine-rich protein [Aureibaculum luteum]